MGYLLQTSFVYVFLVTQYKSIRSHGGEVNSVDNIINIGRFWNKLTLFQMLISANKICDIT